MSAISDRAYAVIRDAIITGEYAEGVRLREEELAARADVSRTPIREAIRRLSAEGFVQLQPKVGAVVARWDPDDVRDLFGIRAALEGYSASLAATKACRSDVDKLSEMCDNMENLAAERSENFLEDFSKANTLFHTCLLQISGNMRLESTARPLMDLALIMQTYRRFSEARIMRSCADHRDLVAALRTGNPTWAEAIMRTHILASAELHQSRQTGAVGQR